ncbi:MAG: hypothetical protein HYT35_00295 [Candidatus Staskawiczbacteria bacterium]|nr:hypothetical protein [Candidatus Staskawiczbacteria bacterium]
MNYLVIGVGKDNLNQEIGEFKANSDGEAYYTFWKEYASNLRFPDYDLILYRVGLLGKKIFITSDY